MFLTLTPNPALDRVLTLDRAVRQGQLHRVQNVHEQAGGKGINVSRILQTLGAEVTNAVVLGGFNGQKFAHLLVQEGLAGITEQAASGETRECQILIDGTSHPTEVNEAGLPFDAAALARLLAKLPAGKMIVSGSLPPGMELKAFADLLKQTCPLAVDTSGPALRVAVEAGVALVKPNLDELRVLIGGVADLPTARGLYARYGTPMLLTRGADGAWLVGPECWEAKPPVTRVSNPVGAGDSTLAGFLWAQQAGYSPPEALRWAVAAGSTSAQQGGPQQVRREQIEAMYAQTEVGEAG